MQNTRITPFVPNNLGIEQGEAGVLLSTKTIVFFDFLLYNIGHYKQQN